MNNSLLDLFRQPGLAAPRGIFSRPGGGRIPFGDTHLERIIPNIRHARVPGPTLAGIHAPYSPRFPSTPINQVPSAPPTGPWTNIPLGRSGIDHIEGPMPRPQYPSSIGTSSMYDAVKTRLSSIARGSTRIIGGIGRAAAAGLTALGPLGVAIAVGLVVAAAVGALGYFFYKRSQANLPKVVEETVDAVLPDPAQEVPSPAPIVVVPEQPPDKEFTGWEGNVPWMRRPGRNLKLSEVFGLNDALRVFAPRL